MNIKALILAASCAALFAAGGCSTLSDYGSVRKESVRNEQGHLIGYREVLRNNETGEVIAQVQLFTPRYDDAGRLVGYEERAKGGAIIRDLDGQLIGGRFNDLRSRKGLTIVMRPADAQPVAATKPMIWQLLASLSSSDLRRIQ